MRFYLKWQPHVGNCLAWARTHVWHVCHMTSAHRSVPVQTARKHILHFSVGGHKFTSWFQISPHEDEDWHLTLFMLYLPATHLVCWHLLCCDRCVHGPGGTCLNNWSSTYRWHHDMRHTIAGRFDRQVSGVRWRGLGQAISGDQTYLGLWKILEILALCCFCLSVTRLPK